MMQHLEIFSFDAVLRLAFCAYVSIKCKREPHSHGIPQSQSLSPARTVSELSNCTNSPETRWPEGLRLCAET